MHAQATVWNTERRIGADRGGNDFDCDRAIEPRVAQAVGTYKCCATVYGALTRNYAFDTDFLTPALLPPNTPMFRDMNAVGFSRDLRPGKSSV
jgi:hypothetical protein